MKRHPQGHCNLHCVSSFGIHILSCGGGRQNDETPLLDRQTVTLFRHVRRPITYAHEQNRHARRQTHTHT